MKKSQRTGDIRAFRRQLEDVLQEQSPGDAEKEPRKQETDMLNVSSVIAAIAMIATIFAGVHFVAC